MVDLDEIQRRSFFKTAANWKVLWVKFFDQWGPLADRMPTLKRIVEKHDKLVLLHISIMEPGTELPMHEGISPAVVRYHLPIQVPPGDNVFLNINGYKVNWEVGNGYVFDDCVRHGVMMKPRVNMKRIIIFADIPREFDGILGPFYETLCAFFHASIRNNTNVEEIKKRIVQHQNSEIIELEKSHS
jgi:beta-hydroxylase